MNQVCGYTPLSLQVYAERQTMPNGFVFPRIRSDRDMINSA